MASARARMGRIAEKRCGLSFSVRVDGGLHGSGSVCVVSVLFSGKIYLRRLRGGAHRRCEPPKITPLRGAVSRVSAVECCGPRSAICRVMPPSREARIGISNGKLSLEIPIIFCSLEQKMWNDVDGFRFLGGAVRRRRRTCTSRKRVAVRRVGRRRTARLKELHTS